MKAALPARVSPDTVSGWSPALTRVSVADAVEPTSAAPTSRPPAANVWVRSNVTRTCRPGRGTALASDPSDDPSEVLNVGTVKSCSRMAVADLTSEAVVQAPLAAIRSADAE